MVSLLFDGDADGIIASYIWQKNNGFVDTLNLVSGLKGYPILNNNPQSQGTNIILLDQSPELNLDGIKRETSNRNHCHVIDHHNISEGFFDSFFLKLDKIPQEHCTTSYLNAKYNHLDDELALIAALSDNVSISRELISKLDPTIKKLNLYKEIGRILGYNAVTENSLDPKIVLRNLINIGGNINDFISNSSYLIIKEEYLSDISQLNNLKLSSYDFRNIRIFILPNSRWAKKLFPEIANSLFESDQSKIYLVMAPVGDGSYYTSIRAPCFADRIARLFGGGGRSTASGARINLTNCRLVEIINKIEAI